MNPIIRKIIKCLLFGIALGVAWIVLAGLLAKKAHAAEPDKIKHFAVSALISGTAYQVAPDHKEAWAIGTALTAGVAKELYDRHHGNRFSSGRKFDNRDLRADILGTAFGMMVSKHLIVTNRSVTYVSEF